MHRGNPLVHAAWTANWWRSNSLLDSIFGPHPSDASLRTVADALAGQTFGDWRRAIPDAPPGGIARDALVVLAGQQPVLAGGPLLVAHKAATAIRLARHLAATWKRPVVPLFLIADEDHDASEVDHVDIITQPDGLLSRIRCPLLPRGEALYRCAWDAATLGASIRQIACSSSDEASGLRAITAVSQSAGPASRHVAELLRAAFGHLGLVTVSAHAVTGLARHVLDDALRHEDLLAAELAAGGRRLAEAGLPSSFDAADRRPLVMESRGSRRRRIAAGDTSAAARLAAVPDDFSPHAALRPVVQAAALPVVAQVCGPSELLYLGQARGLHARYGLQAPILVPRLEATRLRPADVALLGGDLARIDLSGASAGGGLPLREEQELIDAARSFARQVLALDKDLAGRTARWLAGVERGARRLAEAPAWRGRVKAHTLQHLRPRGRWQDTVLAWLPDACAHGHLARWADRIVALSEPLQPPAHVLHVLPEELADG